MEKTKSRYTFLLIYEVLRLMFIVTIWPAGTSAVQSLSWYAGAGMLIVPFILCFFLYRDEQKYRMYLPLLGSVKIVGIVALLGFALSQVGSALNEMNFGYNYSIQIVLLVLLVMVFDGIIGGGCFSRNKRIMNSDAAAEGDECK